MSKNSPVLRIKKLNYTGKLKYCIKICAYMIKFQENISFFIHILIFLLTLLIFTIIKWRLKSTKCYREQLTK